MVRRRSLLLWLAAAPTLVGCLTLPDGGRTPTGGRTVSIVDRDPAPDLPVRPSVEVATPEATDAGPPELHATLENVADYPVQVGEERAIVFAFVDSEERPGLTLLPVGDDYPSVEPGCWRLAEPVAIPEYYGTVDLDPGETVARRVGAWGSPDGDGCLPTGRFRFTTLYAGARDLGEGFEEQQWQADWGFTLAVT